MAPVTLSTLTLVQGAVIRFSNTPQTLLGGRDREILYLAEDSQTTTPRSLPVSPEWMWAGNLPLGGAPSVCSSQRAGEKLGDFPPCLHCMLWLWTEQAETRLHGLPAPPPPWQGARRPGPRPVPASQSDMVLTAVYLPNLAGGIPRATTMRPSCKDPRDLPHFLLGLAGRPYPSHPG